MMLFCQTNIEVDGHRKEYKNYQVKSSSKIINTAFSEEEKK